MCIHDNSERVIKTDCDSCQANEGRKENRLRKENNPVIMIMLIMMMMMMMMVMMIAVSNAGFSL